MDQIVGDFYTGVYNSEVQGEFCMSIPDPIPANFNTQITLTYLGTYRYGQSASFNLECIYSPEQKRLIGQTKLAFAQMFAITLIFYNQDIYGFYSSLKPTDSGDLKNIRFHVEYDD
jgi:hypothetical protein